MKKILPIILCFVIAAGAFAACSKTNTEEETTTPATTVENPTDDAVIKEADSIHLIESYTDEELGLDAETREQCSFMVASSGEKLEDGLFIKVIATIKTAHENEETGQTTYTFDTKGEYFISYDGNKVVRRDGDTYTELQVRPVPTTVPPTTHPQE